MQRKQFTATKTFKLSSFNIINFTGWTNANGEQKEGITLQVGRLDNGNVVSMSYSPNMVSTFRVENGRLKFTDESKFHIIKVKFVVDNSRIYKTSVLENGTFTEYEFSQDELFEMLSKEQEKAVEYIKSTEE